MATHGAGPDPAELISGVVANARTMNAPVPVLVQNAVSGGEGRLGHGGALLVRTGRQTGRSPKDKFIVEDPEIEDRIWREANPATSAASFDRLLTDMATHLWLTGSHVQDLRAGADPSRAINVRVATELAWHGLFIRQLLRRPQRTEIAGFVPDLTILNAPSFAADPKTHGCRSRTVVAMDLRRRIVLIAGTEYAGEIKKSVFTYLNFLLPLKNVLSMHCSANHAKDDPGNAAIFFGLSGTGKTTLSSDRRRVLIGDDEHGWSDDGIFNIEGGCYAKTVKLSEEAEPEIHAATSMFGTVLENIVCDANTMDLDFNDTSLTENTRCGYPLEFMPGASRTGLAGQPKHIFMLTCDAFGVLPPIARLTAPQAMYHFLSGFTSKVAGTEQGISDPEPVFSTCFGSPFLPLRPEVYGSLLQGRIRSSGASCWLINTGWTGGPYGEGSRMPIVVTRCLLNAALNGTLADADFRRNHTFGFDIPMDVHGVPQHLLDPRRTWSDSKKFDRTAEKLVGMFNNNFRRFENMVDDDVRRAAVGYR